MTREITDNPGGWTRSLPGHTVEYESGFAMPFYVGNTLVVNAGQSGTGTYSFNNEDFIYFVDMVNIVPQSLTQFVLIVYVNGIPYVGGAALGYLNIPLRQNPSIQFIQGDELAVGVVNLDAAQQVFNIKINGTKLKRPAGFGHPPGAVFTQDSNGGAHPKTITFTDGSTFSPTSWEWDFRDGSPKSTEQNPSHTYTVAGVYYPKLIARNAYGWDSYVDDIPITIT